MQGKATYSPCCALSITAYLSQISNALAHVIPALKRKARHEREAVQLFVLVDERLRAHDTCMGTQPSREHIPRHDVI